MMKTPKRLATLLILVVSLVLFLTKATPVSTAGQSDKEQSLGIKTYSVVERPEEVTAYWTADRKAHAKPVPLLVAPVSKRNPVVTSKSKKDRKPPLVITTGNSCAGGPAQIGSPASATVVADPTKYPYCSMGKLFFTNNGADYVCSASAVSEFVYMTAGHCVYGTEHSHVASAKLLFAAQYELPSEQDFTAAKPGWFLQWQNNEDYNYDIGLVKTNTSMKVIGNLGLTVADWVFFSCCPHAAGYPSQAPFPGDKLYEAYGQWTGHDLSYTLGMNGNNMTPGSSGGPWFVENSTTHDARIIGLNSYSHGSAPPMYSPELRFPVADLWKCVNQGC